MTNKRYSNSVYEVTTKVSYLQSVEKTTFNTFKEAKKYTNTLKSMYPNIQIVSIQEVKVYSTT